MGIAVIVVALVVLAVTTPFWWPADERLHHLSALGSALLLAGLWVVELYVDGPDGTGHSLRATDIALLGITAVLAGGPVTAALLSVLEQPGDADAGEVLRGGAWIGVLERAAVFLAVVSSHPEAVALVVAVKGLGRYPELRTSTGAAERFIAGTLASLLWAGGCALVVQGLVQGVA